MLEKDVLVLFYWDIVIAVNNIAWSKRGETDASGGTESESFKQLKLHTEPELLKEGTKTESHPSIWGTVSHCLSL